MGITAEHEPSASRRFDLSFLGLCLPQIWIYCIAHRPDGVLSETQLGIPLYLSLTATMLIAVAFVARNRTFPDRLWLDSALAILQGAATIMLVAPFGSFGALQQDGAATLWAVAGGAGIAWLYLLWAPFFAKLETKTSVGIVFAAMAIGSVLKIPLDLLPPWPAALAIAVLPLLSVALASRARRLAPAPSRPPRIFHEGNPSSIPWGILVAVATYSLVIGVVKTVPVAAQDVSLAALTTVHHGVEVLLALALLWWVFGLGKTLSFSGLWRIILLFTAATLLFLPVVGPSVTPWVLLASGVAQTLVVMLLWCMLADVAHHSNVSPIVIFGSGWAAYSLPLAIGEVLGGVFSASEMGSLLLAALAYLMTCAAVVSLSDSAFSQKRIFSDLGGTAPEPSTFQSLDESCKRIGTEKGLTAREVEILRMIVRGRSKSYIAENLFISENTVRSHAKHIYQKLGVHSKQEVLDLLGVEL